MDSHNIDGGYAWVILAVSFLAHVMTYGLAWSTGVYNVIFLEAFGQPKSVTAWAGSLPTAVMYGIGPIASMLSNKYGFRPTIIMGGVMISAGLCLSYFATSLYYLFFTFGFLTGAGLGIVYIPAISAVSHYFEKRIAIASGIAASGVGIGNFLYPPLIRWLVNTYDWKQSFLILGAISLNICVLGALARPVKRFEIKENQPILDITPFRKISYVFLCFNVFFFCCGISALYVHIAAQGEYIGINADKSALLISGLGIANLVGRFGYGVIASVCCSNAFIMYAVSFGLSGVCIAIVPFMKSFEMLMVCVVGYGIFSGCFGTLLVKILIDLLGLHRFANGYGCLLLFMAAGSLTGGFLAGAVFDLTGSYSLAFIIGGGLCIVSALIMIQPYLYVRKHTGEDVIEIPVEKAALSEDLDAEIDQYTSHRELVQMTVSLESLSVAKKVLEERQAMMRKSTMSLQVTGPKDLKKTSKTNNGKVYLPIHKDLLALKCTYSTETI